MNVKYENHLERNFHSSIYIQWLSKLSVLMDSIRKTFLPIGLLCWRWKHLYYFYLCNCSILVLYFFPFH